MRSRWSPTTKRLVVLGLAALGLVILWRAGDIVEPFVWAVILSYILLPLVGAIQRRFSLPRTGAALIVFIGVLAVIFGGGRLLVPRAAATAPTSRGPGPFSSRALARRSRTRSTKSRLVTWMTRSSDRISRTS